MERDEAKIILALCRTGKAEDLQDPIIAEAFALLEKDAELKTWYEAQQEFDERFGNALNAIQPPAELKASILSGMGARVKGKEDGSAPAKKPTADSGRLEPPTTSPRWWRNPWIGIAAVFTLLFALAAISNNDPADRQTSSSPPASQAGIPAMIQFLASELDTMKRESRSFDMRSDEPASLQSYLASVGTPSPKELPAAVDSKQSIGCFTLDYNGVKMGMICFKGEQVVHLITGPKTACTNHITEDPSDYEVNDQAFKIWIEGDQVYILSIKGSKEKLPKFI